MLTPAGTSTALEVDLAYNGDSQLTSLSRSTWSSATQTHTGTTSYLYDAVNRMSGIDYYKGGGSALASIAYTYNSANELTSEQDDTGTPTSFAYDDSGELTQDGTVTYAYDTGGNRTQAGTYTYSTPGAGNELTNDGTWTYTYDAVGNLIEKQNASDTWTYGYDNANHMITAKDPSGLAAVSTVLPTPKYDTIKQNGNDCAFAATVASLVRAQPDAIKVIDDDGENYSVMFPGLGGTMTFNLGEAVKYCLSGKQQFSTSGVPNWMEALSIAAAIRRRWGFYENVYIDPVLVKYRPEIWADLGSTSDVYQSLQGPRMASTWIKVLTGHSSSSTGTTWNSNATIEAEIKNAVKEKKVICGLTWFAAGDNGIESWHWYAIVGYRAGFLELYNPWGSNTREYTVGGMEDGLGLPSKGRREIRGGGKGNSWMTISEFDSIFHQITYED